MASGQVTAIASGNPVSPIPLWMSSRECGHDTGRGDGVLDDAEQLSGDVALQTADDLAAGFAFGEPPVHVAAVTA